MTWQVFINPHNPERAYLAPAEAQIVPRPDALVSALGLPHADPREAVEIAIRYAKKETDDAEAYIKAPENQGDDRAVNRGNVALVWAVQLRIQRAVECLRHQLNNRVHGMEWPKAS